MKNFFNRILVPIVYCKETEHLIDNSIQLANEFKCDLYIVYATNPSRSSADKNLEELIESKRASIHDGLLLHFTPFRGSWQQILKEAVIKSHIDLVLIPISKLGTDPISKQIDINILSQQTQCPVLTIYDNFDPAHLQNIVVPVDDFLPVRKLTAATFLAKKFDGVIHLLGQQYNSDQAAKLNTICLTKAYQLLRDFTNVKIHCSTERGSTVAADTLAYARKVQADLIVVNPGKESKMGGIFNKWLARYLHRVSNIPVLTIATSQH